LQPRERTDHKSAALSVARKLCRRPFHILRELGEQAPAPLDVDAHVEETIHAAA
jgi:RIO-like serine/threonine protein kinase